MKNIDSTKIIDTIRNINPKEILNTKQITSSIQIVDPIKVIDITEKGFDFGLWISVLIAIISTSILIWNEIKKSKVYGKVISKTYSQTATYSFETKTNEKKTINGQQYILKLSLSCLRKSLNYKDVNVFLTYGNEKVAGEIYWTKYNNLNFENSGGTTSKMQMLTPADDFLTFNNVLEQGKTSFFYLNFIVPNKTGAILYDKLELEFVKPNDNKVNVEIFEIDAKQYFFDENLIKS
jgi:hypothetical protein